MITAKEAREIPVKVKETIEVKQLSRLEMCEAYIREAAEDGLTEIEEFSMPDDLLDELRSFGYKVEITIIPNDPRLVTGWTISWGQELNDLIKQDV